ncbi:uncharacterized protein [Physcomitrium patens]|uniref:Alpha-1,4 glucan phosphorylase n=1 Tax=Physcomitrium patens TaxID=3218 RepID=A0A2K1KEE7_PHYPA|nr:glycogen phosphorylase 1-like [Physcomitrium patens]XP_024378555.1 glycogen phosphorylase 1-like [Physcomitrium patens]XP_024378556.1 glycogen phosphorylase 1-like [Physcomitrium patens]XP_024378557.1 glycogen phosphorylase 1-like [Physcomitrium patens]XP_024378558.1 glycogen phosphorylase 1-like [Physcomitrium patens]XP_024378559.1 glycogen phosphorylase 1-like [Physcomitrium patens]PNR52155.1 hypothetical protein PHYPA_008529 [Physcomitrium patens]|eukprot:XP_024378554.1 glycogen phosphorylase 1-like [Physcomitrella patens]
MHLFGNGSTKQAPEEVEHLQRELLHHAQVTYAHPRPSFNTSVMYEATAQTVRDRLVERWLKTEEHYTKTNAKRIYYLSLEYLVGRSLLNAILNLRLKGEYSEALKALGYHLEETVEEERDAGLGNGGLGRLASCFLDSMATLSIPSVGYGIRYKYGIFEQLIQDNKQIERPDYWLSKGNPWEIERLDVVYPVRFYGHVVTHHQDGKTLFKWEGGEVVQAVAYDTPIPGFGTVNTNTMRLWSARPLEEFGLGEFNEGHYAQAVEARVRAEAISSVLYPNDNHDAGKELRLKQQYFFVSATLQDIMKRYKASGDAISKFDTKVAVQLNDTHPTIAIPELMRLFLDEEGMSWDAAWDITTRVFGYTNHTILPEALEKWSVPLMQKLLPRHLEIIYEINHRHLQVVEGKWKNDTEKLIKMSIIEEGNTKAVRMAILATVGSHAINGVAEIHSGLVKTSLFPEFVELSPQKFQNKTNGVTPRRWILQANPGLSKIITKAVETEDWVLNLDLLQRMKHLAGNKTLQHDFQAAKSANKAKLAALIKSRCGVEVSEKALFDVQIKRIHEYKRQLLNILSLIYRYQCIKRASPADRAKFVKRVAIFAGKAAPGYYLAKRIIQLINAVGARVNNDPDVGDTLKVVFIPNYSVSLAEVIIPANDISQHISTAGMEASGTSNMKFVMNGGLIVGTMDGANIEIANACGRENMFVFGATAEEVGGLRHALKHKGEDLIDERLLQVYHSIEAGDFGPYEEFEPILYSLREGRDYYLLAHDWPSYLDAQEMVDQIFVDESEWTRRCITSTSMMGVFSSDRTIAEYAKDIWNVKSAPVPSDAKHQ